MGSTEFTTASSPALDSVLSHPVHQSLVRANAFHSQQDIMCPCHERNTMRCVSTAGSWGHFGEPGPLVQVFAAGVSTEQPVTETFTGPNQFPAPEKVLRSIPKKVWVGLGLLGNDWLNLEHVTGSKRGALAQQALHLTSHMHSILIIATKMHSVSYSYHNTIRAGVDTDTLSPRDTNQNKSNGQNAIFSKTASQVLPCLPPFSVLFFIIFPFAGYLCHTRITCRSKLVTSLSGPTPQGKHNLPPLFTRNTCMGNNEFP